MGDCRQYACCALPQESPEEVEPSKTFEEGLDKVIACQNSGIGAYDGVSSWKELVLRRARCDANWKDGLYSLSTIYQTDVWRLKVSLMKCILKVQKLLLTATWSRSTQLGVSWSPRALSVA